MFDAERKKRRRRYPKRFSQLQQTEKRAFANWRASDKCGNTEIWRRSSSSFTAPKLNIGYEACQRFCFVPVISLNNFERFKFEDNRSAQFKRLARSKPESNQYFEIIDQTSFMLNLKLKYTKQSICDRNLVRLIQFLQQPHLSVKSQ